MSKKSFSHFPRQKGVYPPHTHTHTYTPHYTENWEFDKIADFCENLKVGNIVEFKCMLLENVHEFVIDESSKMLTELKPIMKVGVCSPEGSNEYFTVVDPLGIMQFGHNIMGLKAMNPDEIKSMPRYDRWKEMVKGECYYAINPVNSLYLIKQMKRHKILFRHVLNYLVDDTRQKEKVIVDIAKASRLPLPIRLRENLQPYNCNFILLGNSGCGKSIAFSRLTGVDSPQTVTEAGLIGGIKNMKGVGSSVVLGILQGEGVAVIDEAGRSDDDNDDATPIIEKTLNYTETGEARRSLVQPIVCNGTKSIVAIGNSDYGDTDLSGLRRFIIRKCTLQAVERIGRRYPVVIYRSDLRKIDKHESNYAIVSKCRFVVDNILNQNKDKIVEMINYGIKWCSQNDVSWRNRFKEISNLAANNVIRELLIGISDAFSRVKFAALKVAIFNNMDLLIVAKKGNEKNLVKGLIMREAKETYWHFESEILRSFSVIKASPYSEMMIMLRKKAPINEIVKKTGISKSSIYRYMDDIGMEPYGR